MTIPGIVQSALDGEEIETRVPLGGDDELFVTPSKSIVFRAEGLLSSRRIIEFPHDAERLSLSEGRRKTTITLEYPLDGPAEFTIPASKTDDVLQPLLAGVLGKNGTLGPDESVRKIYRFSELTLILTSDRLVKHVGEPVWDDDDEEYHFDDVTNLSFEDGSVATQIVLSVDGRPQRIKAPKEDADDLRERLKRALFEYHEVDSLAELNDALGESEATDGTDSVDPLDATASGPEGHDEGGASTTDAAAQPSPTELLADERGAADAQSGQPTPAETSQTRSNPTNAHRSESVECGSTTGIETGTRTETGTDDESNIQSEPNPELLERLENLERAVEQQNDRLEQQQQLLEQLIAELRQGR